MVELGYEGVLEGGLGLLMQLTKLALPKRKKGGNEEKGRKAPSLTPFFKANKLAYFISITIKG